MCGGKADRRAPRTEKGRGTQTTGADALPGVTAARGTAARTRDAVKAAVPTSTPANTPVRRHGLAVEPDRRATL